jgi:hypothetical protein
MIKYKLKSVATGAAATLLIAAVPAAVLAKSSDSNSNAHNKVTICHATGSQTNPFVMITPNANGVVNGHQAHQDGNDIIPPFDYNDHGTTVHFAGQNWDSTGQAIFNNGCKVTSTEGGGGGGQMDCDNDTDNSPATDCQTPTGGQGGGNEQNTQVLGAVTGGQGGVGQTQQSGVTETPQGGVNAGAGGGSTLGLSL